jgi:hypothetical protein
MMVAWRPKHVGAKWQYIPHVNVFLIKCNILEFYVHLLVIIKLIYCTKCTVKRSKLCIKLVNETRLVLCVSNKVGTLCFATVLHRIRWKETERSAVCKWKWGTCPTVDARVGNKTNMQNTPLQQRIGKTNAIMEKLQGYNPTSSITKKIANSNKNHITIFLKKLRNRQLSTVAATH